MIVFTALNSKTQQYYVGIATDSKENRWQKFVKASAQNIDAPIYQDLREYGSESFLLSDYAETDDREEMGDLLKEAIIEFNAISLQGIKTAAPIVAAAPVKKATKKPPARGSSSLFAEPESATKIASGRTTSSKKEKNIREAIAKEKAAREQEKQAKIAAEADEMKAIMARLDSRSASTKRRR